jgi:hypothetical protein
MFDPEKHTTKGLLVLLHAASIHPIRDLQNWGFWKAIHAPISAIWHGYLFAYPSLRYIEQAIHLRKHIKPSASYFKILWES